MKETECNSTRMSTSDVRLAVAIQLAAIAHEGQVDLAGRPYVLHPLHVMFQMQDDTERIVAVLHDYLEDTLWSPGILEEFGFERVEIDAIVALTRQPGERYFDYIKRVRQNPVATKVKIQDIHHNLEVGRLSNYDEKKIKSLLKRYHKALRMLTDEGAVNG